MRPQASHSFPHTDSKRAAPRGALRLRIMLLATSALVSASLSTTVAHAGDAIWSGAPIDAHFDNAANWVGGAIPDGTATFGPSSRQNLDIAQSTTLGGITVMSGAGDYAFASNFDISFIGAGISVQNGASATFFLGGTTTFQNSASAGSAIINNDGTLQFNGTSTAGQATIANSNGASTVFWNSSTADHATITNNDLSATVFIGGSTADHAQITNNDTGGIFFEQQHGGPRDDQQQQQLYHDLPGQQLGGPRHDHQ